MFPCYNWKTVMIIQKIEFKEETIQTIREIKKIMLTEWNRHRAEVDQIIKRVRSSSLYPSKIEIEPCRWIQS